jgi:hypothetical protein
MPLLEAPVAIAKCLQPTLPMAWRGSLWSRTPGQPGVILRRTHERPNYGLEPRCRAGAGHC